MKDLLLALISRFNKLWVETLMEGNQRDLSHSEQILFLNDNQGINDPVNETGR